MNSLFESFCRLIDEVPNGAVLRTIETEGKMLLKDLTERRVSAGSEEERDARSILTFAEFISHEWCTEAAAKYAPPLEHLAYYRRVVERMVDAGGLPYLVKEAFDRAFSSIFLKELGTL